MEFKLSPNPKEITVRNFRVDPKDIVFIKAILESYEGMVVVRTVEAGENIIELLIASDFVSYLEPVIREIQSQAEMEEVFLDSTAAFN